MWLPKSGVQCLLKIYNAKFLSGLLHCSLCFSKVGLLCLHFSRSDGLCCNRMLLLGAVCLAEILKHGWIKILHCRWAMCVCCCYVLELGGCCPTLSKFVVLGL